VQPDHLRQRLLGRLPRVQAGVRVLEHDLDLTPPASPVAGGAGRPGAVVPAGGDGAAHIWQVRDELPLVADDDIFESILAIVIAGLCQRAPRPCTCAEHAAT